MNTRLFCRRLAASAAFAVCLGTASAQQPQAAPTLVYHRIMDPEAGMPVCAFPGPSDWKLESEVRWNLAESSVPIRIGAALTNPETLERLQFFPDTTCYWLTGDAALNNPGARNLGMINLAPMEPAEALVSAVRTLYRAELPDLEITGVREVPGLAEALGQGGAGFRGVGLRAVFSIDDTPVEEEIYALYFHRQATLRGEAGVTTQTTWGLASVHGFMAPRGRLPALRSMFTYMTRSLEMNPAWVQLLAQVKQRLDQEFARDIRNNRLARERIMARSRALAAENDAFRARIMARHRRAMDTTAHERFIDSIHEVETMNDPQWGTSKQPYAKQHWTDGWGNYIHSDDLDHDPNRHSRIEWKRMTPAD